MSKVFVGLSGGVDSSVAAARLLQAGHEVVGVFIKVWHPDWLVCNWEQERLDAMRVAAHLGIPFLTCNAEAAYRDSVAAYFIEEYKAGRTPNPDVMCNQHVKFGRFLEFACEHGAEYIATGHYARRIDTPTGPELHAGIDISKDQSYFLWSLTADQLAHSLFPIGDTPKSAIRAEATTLELPVADKRDSQGICFLGHIDITEFLGQYVDLQPGNVLNTSGQVIGTHQGALLYTIGQRQGFTLHDKSTDRTAQYVVATDIDSHTITVAPNVPSIGPDTQLQLKHTVLRADVRAGDVYDMVTRYHGPRTPITIVNTSGGQLLVEPVAGEATSVIAAGQSCVLYLGSHCIGGGIVT
jgi:tRNA-specific 2-thiouridylase